MAIRFDLLEYGQDVCDESEVCDCGPEFALFECPAAEDYDGHGAFFHDVAIEESNG